MLGDFLLHPWNQANRLLPLVVDPAPLAVGRVPQRARSLEARVDRLGRHVRLDDALGALGLRVPVNVQHVNEALVVLALELAHRRQIEVDVRLVARAELFRVRGARQRLVFVPAEHDAAEHHGRRIDRGDGRGERLRARHHLVVRRLVRVDSRMGGRPERRLVVERVELDSPLRGVAQLVHEEIDELVLVDRAVVQIGRRAVRSTLVGIGPVPALAGGLLRLAHRLVLVRRHVVDERDGRERLGAEALVVRGKIEKLRSRLVAVLVAERGARPVVAHVPIVFARVRSIVLPVVRRLPVPTHASHGDAEPVGGLRVDAVDVRADGTDDGRRVDVDGQRAAVGRRQRQDGRLLGRRPVTRRGQGGHLDVLAEVFNRHAGDLDDFPVVAEAKDHLPVARAELLRGDERNVESTPVRPGLDVVGHRLGVGLVRELEDELGLAGSDAVEGCAARR